MEKLNLTQQKHALTNQKKRTTIQNKHKKTKARFSRLLRHPAWKRSGSVTLTLLLHFVLCCVFYITCILFAHVSQAALVS